MTSCGIEIFKSSLGDSNVQLYLRTIVLTKNMKENREMIIEREVCAIDAFPYFKIFPYGLSLTYSTNILSNFCAKDTAHSQYLLTIVS